MELASLTIADALKTVHAQSGVSENNSELTTELVAAGLRRAASLMCPATPRALVQTVDLSLAPLFPNADCRKLCRTTLDDLLTLGDLTEYEEVTLNHSTALDQRRLIYSAPPYFVELNDSRFLILGIAPDGIDYLPKKLQPNLKGTVRSIRSTDNVKLRQSLLHAGFHAVSYAAWAKAPKVSTAEVYLQLMDHQLETQKLSGEFESLSVLNGAIISPWYKQRWVEPRGLTGRYIGRRPRKYGADLWCYVELHNGEPQRLVDLPIGHTIERGCDQAWRLQCALDAKQGIPQTFNQTKVGQDRIQLDIHLPCPGWLQRRWDCIGERANKSVFSYLFDPLDITSEVKILREQLWMSTE